MNKNKALVVLSGGQDSVTCLFWALERFDCVEAITFDYGQTHRIEIESARKACEIARVKQHVVKVPDVLKSTSPLVDKTAKLDKYESFDAMEEIVGDKIEKTFVPMRNTFFLTIAANYAVALDAGALVTGVCQQDNANYPDCTEPFIRLMSGTINQSLGLEPNTLIIHTPLMNLSKADTCKLLYSMSATSDALRAMAYSHTSYDGKYPPVDNNHSNLLRAEGFELANLPDPLVLRAWIEGVMDLPNTPNYDRSREMGPIRVAGKLDLYCSVPPDWKPYNSGYAPTFIRSEGFEAFEGGLGHWDCPYGGAFAEAWTAGFNDAAQQSGAAPTAPVRPARNNRG